MSSMSCVASTGTTPPAPSTTITRKVAGLFISPERLCRFFCLHGGQVRCYGRRERERIPVGDRRVDIAGPVECDNVGVDR